MWSPTHIKVTINSARNLLCKGKNNTNNCFVTIGLGKEKYQTSVKEKAESKVEWKEECELKIPDQGNRAELVLTCLHRNNLGIDEFLGQVTLPLNEMDAYVRSKAKWYKLESKPGKEKKNKERGELEVEISFTVKSGSLTDLSKKEKHKSSIGQLASSVGGSLLSISTIEKRKGIKKIAKKFGSKLHLSGSGKKKNKDDDDMSYTGSFASIGTPNRVRVPDSDDEDEFQFDKLSQKSSVSSLNIRDGLQPPNQNYTQRNPSPLMGSTGKGQIGKDHHYRYDGSDNLSVDPELEEIENEFSIRARTLPPPTKPPRTPQMDGGEMKTNGKELDEWESKLYGRSVESNNSDSLKRRSWEPVAVPLKTTTYEEEEEEKATEKQVSLAEAEPMSKSVLPTLQESQTPETFSDSSSSSDEEVEPEKPKQVVAPLRPANEEKTKEINSSPTKPTDLKLLPPSDEIIVKKDSLLSPDVDKNEFAKFNASFAKFEQRNSSKFFDIGNETNNFLKNESLTSGVQQPQPKPRARIAPIGETEENNKKALEEEEQKRKRQAEDARLEDELKENERRLREEEEALQKEQRHKEEEEKRREAKRREEDFRILNFSKRLVVSQEDKPEEKPQERIIEAPLVNNKEQYKEEKKLEINNKKERQFNIQREKQTVSNATTPSPKQNERIIIGHEKATTQADRRAEISAALAKKYEGKSREELMLIANGMENEALIQRQRVKELEDYLDNLLLRVMETHPKILQNPYSRTTSAKSNNSSSRTQFETETTTTTTKNDTNSAQSRLESSTPCTTPEEEEAGEELEEVYSSYKTSCNNNKNSNNNVKKSVYTQNTSVANTNMPSDSMTSWRRRSWCWWGSLRPSTAACVTLLILTTTCSLCAASLCESQSWWDPYKDKCIPCTVCQGDMIPLRPCQMHRDTVCGSIYDLKIDWVVLSKTEPNWKERRKFDGLDYGLDHHQLTAEQLQQLQDEADPMDWQTAALFLAVLACLLFFIVAACILVHHMRQWRRMERRLDQDVEELSTKLMAKLAEVQSLEGGTFFIGNADALRIPTSTTAMTTATTFHQPQHVMLPEKSDKHQQNLQHDRRLFTNTSTLKSGNVYIEENSSKC